MSGINTGTPAAESQEGDVDRGRILGDEHDQGNEQQDRDADRDPGVAGARTQG